MYISGRLLFKIFNSNIFSSLQTVPNGPCGQKWAENSQPSGRGLCLSPSLVGDASTIHRAAHSACASSPFDSCPSQRLLYPGRFRMSSLKWPHVLHIADIRGQNQEVSPPSIPRPTDSDVWGPEQSMWFAGLSCVQNPLGADRVQCPLPLPHSTWPHRNIWTLCLFLYASVCLSFCYLCLSLR